MRWVPVIAAVCLVSAAHAEQVALPDTRIEHLVSKRNGVDFNERELFPWLEQRYRAGPERVIVGHSYGGLFALWCALTRPNAFTAAIAVSPSLFYDDHLIARLESKLDPKARASLAMKIYAASGSEENPEMPGDLTALRRTMTPERYPKLKAKLEVLGGETHNSIFPRALSNGLRFLWPRGTFTPSQAPGTRPVGG